MRNGLKAAACAAVMAWGAVGAAESAKAATISEQYFSFNAAADSYITYSINYSTATFLADINIMYYIDVIGGPDISNDESFQVGAHTIKTTFPNGLLNLKLVFDKQPDYSADDLKYDAPTGIDTTFKRSINPVVVSYGTPDNPDFSDVITITGSELTNVPLPSAAPLLGAALVALGGIGYASRRAFPA